MGERAAAEYVAGKLAEVGYEVEVLDSGAPGRSNVFCRLPGADRERGALLVHGHLDVVPAEPSEWSVHPFSGAVQDGYVWGRGAVDMKDMDAMMIAVARRFRRDGVVPPRDLVFAFVADEEAGGARAPSGSSSTGRTCSRAARRRSARSAGSRSRSTSSGST